MLQNIIFEETTTIGIRYSIMERTILPRETRTLPTPWGEVQVKVCTLNGKEQLYPEYESVAQLSREKEIPFAEIYRYIVLANKEKVKKVKDIVKFAIGFTNVKNITAETGERTLYVNIYKPNNEVLTKNAANTFEYENRSLPYSIKKYIEYNGEEQSITVFWNVEEYLSAGTYRVDIFADGTMIGSQRFELE